MTVNKSSVTGNSAGAAGGGMVAWNGPTTVNSSVFSNNTDGGLAPDNPVGVWVAPMNFAGFFINNPSFTTNPQSTFG
jgi:hypothetical protein